MSNDSNVDPSEAQPTHADPAAELEEDRPLGEDDYAQGETSDPDGATRDEPAGEDYAGSGF